MYPAFNGQFDFFSAHEQQLFKEALITTTIPKGECVVKRGAICRSLYFIATGSFVQYTYTDSGDFNAIDLHLQNEWMLNQQSFIRQKPSDNFIEAYCDSVVYELTMQKMHELIGLSPAFFQLARVLEPVHSRTHLFDNQLTPLEKYQYILQHRPGLLQAFPLKIIASYLKITPETLSRVRDKIAVPKNAS